MSLNAAQRKIERHLENSKRLFLRPDIEYENHDMGKPIARQPENMELLAHTITERMVSAFQKQITEAISEETQPIVYVDSKQKGKRDVMFYMLELFVDHYIKENSGERLKERLTGGTILNRNAAIKAVWRDRLEHYSGQDLKADILLKYQEMIEQFWLASEGEDAERIEAYKALEQGNMHRAIEYIIKDFWGKWNLLYLDHPEALSVDEKKALNAFIQTRGSISFSDKIVTVKINDVNNSWKMYMTHSEHSILLGHDYEILHISEKELHTP